MKITILGQTPAQKNNKSIAYNRGTGKPFIMSNQAVKTWQESAKYQIARYANSFKGKVRVDYQFYVKDNRKRDTDNMIATINDALQASQVITGDHWQVLEIGSGKAEIDKNNPRAEITITDLDL